MATELAGGCLRNSGNGWDLYENGGHQSRRITSVTNDDRWITVCHEGPIDAVITIMATADENLAKRGITAGASGGNAYTKIGLYKDGIQLDPNDVDYADSNVWYMCWHAVPD